MTVALVSLVSLALRAGLLQGPLPLLVESPLLITVLLLVVLRHVVLLPPAVVVPRVVVRVGLEPPRHSRRSTIATLAACAQ